MRCRSEVVELSGRELIFQEVVENDFPHHLLSGRSESQCRLSRGIQRDGVAHHGGVAIVILPWVDIFRLAISNAIEFAEVSVGVGIIAIPREGDPFDGNAVRDMDGVLHIARELDAPAAARGVVFPRLVGDAESIVEIPVARRRGGRQLIFLLCNGRHCQQRQDKCK